MATLGARRRLSTAARWPLGVLLTSWHYMWRTTPMSRRELGGALEDHRAPEVPAGAHQDGLQHPRDGAGPVFHRLYRVHIDDSVLSAQQLLERLQRNPDVFAPSWFASFQRVEADSGAARAGDEYVVRMPGPWDGPVRVIDVRETSLRFATLDGHLEAGQIEFRAAEHDGRLTFTIESWARSASRFTDLLYDRIRISKEVQLHLWVSFLERVVKESGGRRSGCIEIRTRRVDEPPGRDHGLGPDDRTRRALVRLRRAPLNFDPTTITADPARWRYDERLQPLPAEAQGPPAPDGSWRMARRLMRGYEFADPSIVRASYDPEVPLERRVMLLEIRFGALRFRVGCCVADVYERVEDVQGRAAVVWGWSYRTLAGHFEQGEMHWQVVKWPDSGEVAFRIRAWSRRADDPNPIIRMGFRIFGRRQQLRFYDSTCERMRRLTEEALRSGSSGEAVRRVSEAVIAHPARGAQALHEALSRSVEEERGERR